MAGAFWERMAFDARNPSDSLGSFCGRRGKHPKPTPPPPGTAISVRNLGKDFRTSWFKFGAKKGVVTAISDLTVDIPKHGIFVLLGPNGHVVFQPPCDRFVLSN